MNESAARTEHLRRGPDIAELLDTLARHDVRYVLTGSVAALVYGARLEPGDLDITPALDHDNLSRLAEVLLEIEAIPDASFGHWETQPGGERKWVADEATPERLAAHAAWVPRPDDLATLDHLFLTRHGNFDVVPELQGRYETLMERAVPLTAYGQSLWVAHLDDLLATLTVPRREKDVARVRQLRDLQRRQAVAGRPGAGSHE